MKKIYTLLFLLMFVLGSAQTQLPAYQVCDEDNNGVEIFNLHVQDLEILGNLNPSDYTISYFENPIDAQSNTNAISNPANYSIILDVRQIYARLTNILTQESSFSSFTLILTTPATANPAVLTFCDPNELPLYNLNDAIPQLIGNQQDVMVVFYDSPNGGNVIVGGMFTPSVFPIQVLGAVVTNNCSSSQQTTITLNTNNCAPCPEPMLLTTSNITDTTAMVSWSAPGSVSLFNLYLTPAGMPAPTATTQPTYSSIQTTNFVLTGLMPDTCYSYYVRSVCNPNPGSIGNNAWVGPFMFCTYNCENNGQCADNLALVAFIDANNNSVKDLGELSFDMGSFVYEINDSGTPLYGNATYGSFHIFPSSPNDSYDLSFAIQPDMAAYFSSSTTYNDILIPTGNGSHTYYFPIVKLQSYKNLEIEIIPSSLPRPGFVYTNFIKYKNKGTETIASGTVSFTKDAAVSIVNILPNTAVNTSNGFNFDFTDLAVNEQRTIQVAMLVPTIPTISLGQVLSNSVTITPVDDDASPANNLAVLSQPIVGSYDPNEKTESHGGKIALDAFGSDDYLTYTILFENTGTANAEFIRVEDLLDSDLDPSSVVMLNASHSYNMRRVNNNLIWNFYDINLPPTATNPTLSHGYIQFKVKPTAGFSIGTKIPNVAKIYFDYNPAIVTDLYETEFVETLSTASFASNGFYMYPNPGKTFIHIGSKNAAKSIAGITVRDILGKSVNIVSNIQSNETTIDVSRFSKGIYFVEITTANNMKMVQKLIIH